MAAAIVLATAYGGTAHAATDGDAATAEVLFQDAKRLMAAGDFDAACPKLSESQSIAPGTGTLLALALCHEKQGKTATAWAEYREVLPLARRDGRTDRESVAKKRAEALESKLARITVSVDALGPSSADVTIKRDGVELNRAVWGTAVPVDAGDHLIEVSGPRRTPWRATVSVRDGDLKTVAVPALTAEGASPGATPRHGTPTSDGTGGGVASSDGSGRRTIGLVVGGVGVVALGLGAVFGIQAVSKSADAKDACPAGTPCRNPEAVATNDDAKTAANIANIGVAVGLVAVAAGAYLILTSRSSTAPAATASTASSSSSSTLRVRVLPGAVVGVW